MREAPPRRPRLRVARGPKRPVYLGDPDLDRVVMMLTALMQEVSAVRDRLDTHERIAAMGAVATPEAVEAFAPSGEDAARRGAWREQFLKRVFRVAFEELEQAERDEHAVVPEGDLS